MVILYLTIIKVVLLISWNGVEEARICVYVYMKYVNDSNEKEAFFWQIFGPE